MEGLASVTTRSLDLDVDHGIDALTMYLSIVRQQLARKLAGVVVVLKVGMRIARK